MTDSRSLQKKDINVVNQKALSDSKPGVDFFNQDGSANYNFSLV